MCYYILIYIGTIQFTGLQREQVKPIIWSTVLNIKPEKQRCILETVTYEIVGHIL